ncbi:MAG: hypothetical protein H9882_02285 [Candidatus Fournierella pullistercoris]|uniref:Uncharacterized protein n=1 Tax=Candidatus Allofournierella pullistercoris TaxID=2838597 RepID=A0A948T271_9FIRM|nr:hypothetical protein [Candidatus Fournierella pullistercoris]
MYTPKRILQKILTGALLLALAMCATVFIRENMDVKDPEQALPSFSILVNDEVRITEHSILRAGYEWNFMTTVAKDTPVYTSSQIRSLIYPVDLPPSSRLVLEFSTKPKTLRVQRAPGADLQQFVELADVSDGTLVAPSQPGLYLYQVECGFGWRGSIRYFFLVRVQQMDTTDSK